MAARLRFARRVTRKHGVIFAEAWRRVSRSVGAMTGACHEARLVEWPDTDDQRLTEAQAHYHRIHSEIAERTFDALRDAIVETFVKVATDVLTRERRRKAGR